MTSAPIYLDYAATTPLDPRVAAHLAEAFAEDGANASAMHLPGRKAAASVARATAQVASLLNCRPRELTFTSGATEANNLAIQGAARYRGEHGKHLVTMPTEHKAVSDVFRALERQGFEVTWLSPQENGRLDLAQLDAVLRDDTQLVSIMYVNNETGVTQDIEAIGTRLRERGILFHVDAAQGFGKLPFDLGRLPVDLASVTAHKIYGPKGVGALYVADRPRCHIEPLMFGGGQQRGRRPGTLPVALISAFGLAADIAAAEMSVDFEHVQQLRDALWSDIRAIAGVALNGDLQHSWPGILNVSAADVEGESLLLALEPLCVSSGSACNSQDREPSTVLRAMGLSDRAAQSAIRFSFGRKTTPADIEQAAALYRRALLHLRLVAGL